MLCQKCWTHEASVHFTTFGPGVSRRRSYCLSCAQGERLSWLLAWAYGADADAGAPTGPEFLDPAPPDHLPIPSLVAVQVLQCECGCRYVLGAEMPCHHRSLAVGEAEEIRHLCHCGAELVALAPRLVCRECGASAWRLVLATVETCTDHHAHATPGAAARRAAST